MIDNKIIRIQAILTKHTRLIRDLHHKQSDVEFNLTFDASSNMWKFEYIPYLGEALREEDQNFLKLLDKVEEKFRKLLEDIRFESMAVL
jgi:hypothetical protein